MNTDRQNIFISGASRGLGRALATALADRGWGLLITARGADALEQVAAELSPQTAVVALPGDIGDPYHRSALAAAAKKMGGLDAIINNAGILGPSPQPELRSYPLEAFSEVLHINLTAQLGILQALAPMLRPDPLVINLSSDAAVEAYPGWGGYGASKAALDHLSRTLAVENPGWRVYSVDPGDMRTAMHQAAFPGEDISDRPLPAASLPGFLALLAGSQPSGRYRAADLAAVATT